MLVVMVVKVVVVVLVPDGANAEYVRSYLVVVVAMLGRDGVAVG